MQKMYISVFPFFIFNAHKYPTRVRFYFIVFCYSVGSLVLSERQLAASLGTVRPHELKNSDCEEQEGQGHESAGAAHEDVHRSHSSARNATLVSCLALLVCSASDKNSGFALKVDAELFWVVVETMMLDDHDAVL